MNVLLVLAINLHCGTLNPCG